MESSLLKRDGAIATVTLNRLNGFSEATLDPQQRKPVFVGQ